MAAHVGHIVDPGRASEHLPARHHHPAVGEAEPGVAGVGGIHPVRLRVQLQRRTGRRHQLRGGRRAPRFHQSHPTSGILGEPSRDDRTGRPGTHDDKIKLFRHDSAPLRPPPIVQQHRTQAPGVYTGWHKGPRSGIALRPGTPASHRRPMQPPGTTALAPVADRHGAPNAPTDRPHRLRRHQEHRPPVRRGRHRSRRPAMPLFCVAARRGPPARARDVRSGFSPDANGSPAFAET